MKIFKKLVLFFSLIFATYLFFGTINVSADIRELHIQESETVYSYGDYTYIDHSLMLNPGAMIILR